MQPPVAIVSQLRGRYRPLALVFLALLGSASLALLWHASTAAPVNWMYIQDAARVLNQDRVTQAGGGLGYSIDLYTTNTFSGNAGALAAFCRAHISTSRVGTVVIVIDTRQGRVAIQDNGKTAENPVSLNPRQYREAQRAFQKTLAGGDFTAATVALLQELSHSSSADRRLASLPWWGAMLLDLVLVCALLVFLFLPERCGWSGATCERDLRSTPLG